MGKGRLEAFTDGVIAIIITIMVLEMKVPQGNDLAALRSAVPVFLAYALSYLNVGIFWNNHHHMLHAADTVNGRVLWTNLLLLFCLSLVPFIIRWIDEAGVTPLPAAAYGIVLMAAGLAYGQLQRAIIACNGPGSRLATAVGGDLKGKLSVAGYLVAVIVAIFYPWIAIALYVAIALMWFIPDRRIEAPAKR